MKNGDVIRLRSWKGDYLSSLGTEPGVTPGDAGEGSEWIVEKYKYAAPGREIVFLKSSKGDYLYRLETSKGVSTGKLEKGYLWLIVADGDKVKLRSYKQDYLHRGPEGITTWGTGKGNLWVIELVQTGKQYT